MKNGTETVGPNKYTYRPVIPIAFIIDALWITLTLIPLELALKNKSEWVVAQKGSPTTKKEYTDSSS